MKQHLSFTILIALLLLLGSAAPATAYKTKNVIIVVIDGLRDSEGFSYEFKPEETEHPYLPFIWNTLKKKGTSYMEMYNMVYTATTPGHVCLLTGTWQPIRNFGKLYDYGLSRSWTPTVFEYARKELGWSEEKCWCVIGKANCWENNFSIHPLYGETYRASRVRKPVTGFIQADSVTVDTLFQVMDVDQPSLVLVNLKTVDWAGHTGNFELYTEAIRLADRAVERIYNRIKSDSAYNRKTTLMITSDHGRHDPGFGDFQHHGGLCHGCKHIPFFMFGPDIRRDKEVYRRVYMTDIAPTVGELLGFATPYARGQVLGDELQGFIQPERFIMKEPDVAAYENMAFVAWSDNRTGIDQVYVASSFDGGVTYDDTVQVSETDYFAIQPNIAADRNGLHVTWFDYGGDLGKIQYRMSPDYGYTWESERLVFENRLENEFGSKPAGTWKPHIISEADRCLVVLPSHPDSLKAFLTEDSGETWKESLIDEHAKFSRSVSSCRLGNAVGAVWTDESWKDGQSNSWEISFKLSEPLVSGWTIERRLTSSNAYSLYPTCCSNGVDYLFVSWADNESGIFQIHIGLSPNKGDWFSIKEIVTNSPGGAWQPKIVWDQENNLIRLVWIDYRDGHGEVYESLFDGIDWTQPVRVTTTSGSVNNLSCAVNNSGEAFLAWENVTSTDCTIGVCKR